MKIIFSEKCLEYRQEGHPESPERVKNAYEFLKNKGYKFVEAKSCSEEDLLLVHSQKHIENIKTGNFSDLDTPVLKNIYDYAKLSAGAAIQAAELSIKKGNAFSLMRPPGHHATRDRVMGFCYFNNIAIATSKLLNENKLERIAILDIDVHHGNGTQQIFLNNKRVLYVSLHQYPLYPGTGLESILNLKNFLLEPFSEEQAYLEKLNFGLQEIIKFKPEMLAISLGFDTYKEEKLAHLKLQIGSYRKIADKIAKLKLPWFAVLEGGYTSKLGECIHEFLQGFGD